MKKHLIFFFLLFILSHVLTAQKSRDALYLKNGSILYGRIIEITENTYRIETPDRNIFAFPSSDVEKFTKEDQNPESRKTSGPGFALEAGVLAGAQNNTLKAPFSFNILANYTFDKQNIMSLGSGVEFLNSTFAPLFFEYKRMMNEKRITPFVFFRGGALLHVGGEGNIENQNQYNYPIDYRGGPSFGIGTGVSRVKDDVETYVSFGYRYAQTSYKQIEYNDQEYTYKNTYNRLEIKFGFRF